MLKLYFPEMLMLAASVVVFKPSAILKQRINAAPASEGLQE